MGTFELFQDKRNEYRWRLKSGNHRTIADSGESYKQRSDCEHGIELVRKAADFEIFQDKGGQFRWRLRASNGQLIADSGEGYTSRSNCSRAVKAVKSVAPRAVVKA